MTTFLAEAQEFLPILLQGVWLTVLVTLGSLALSTLLGLAWVFMRVSGVGWLAWASVVLVNLIRGVPIIVILFYIYFAMPDLGVSLSAVQAAVIGLGLAYSAHQAENFRAAIEAVDAGQRDAAASIGMGWGLSMRRVILPQALRVALPGFGDVCVMVLKDIIRSGAVRLFCPAFSCFHPCVPDT